MLTSRIPASQLPLDIYIRVSRVGKRADTLTSPEEQERDARAFAASRGFEIGEVLPADLDESGATNDRPGLQKGLLRVEEGVSGGLIVSYLSRASRDTRHGLDLLDQITKAGGAVYAPNLPDYTTADGRMLTTIQLAIDTGYRERKREEFERAKAGAIARGIPVHSRAPVGYRARPDRRLEPDPRVAPLVREVFEMRARGHGPVALARFLERHRVRTSQGSRTWSKQAVYGLLRSHVYLGELSYGHDRRYVNAAAHEAIVDLALWQAAQHPNGTGRLATSRAAYLLAGIIRCHACGYCLQGTTTSRRKRIYRCTRRHASGICPDPATVDADPVEKAAVEMFWRVTRDLHAQQRPGDDGSISRLEADLVRAQESLDQWMSAKVQQAVGDLPEYAVQLSERRTARDEAAAELGRARAHASRTRLTESAETLRSAWERMVTADRRELLGLRFDALALRRDRTVVVYTAGSAPPGLPRQGFRRDPQLVPFPDPPTSARVLSL